MKKRIVSLITALVVACSVLWVPTYEVQAVSNTTLSLESAINLTYSNNRDYTKTTSEIFLKKIKYTAAIKSIALKRKTLTTFSWTPLLSFNFPSQPTLSEEYEWQYTPLQLQTEISILQESLNQIKLEAKEEISLLYVDAYILQEKIATAELQREEKVETLNKNLAKLVLGEATQSDIDTMQSAIDTLDSELALYKRNFETTKSDITDLIGLDVTTNYVFSNPLVGTTITRDNLQELIDYALDNSQAYYEATLNAELSLISLNLMASMVQSEYGSDYNLISQYINQAKAGQDIDTAMFEANYIQFLSKVDSYWSGSIRILFIKIPKEWFKGEVDGVRYMEDDPYMLYTAVLEYMDLLEEQENTKKEIEDAIEDGYENLVTANNAYQSLLEAVDEQKADLEQAEQLNKLGELEYSELQTIQTQYEDTLLESMDSLASYSEQLYAFDTLTCGGVSKYLSGESLVSDVTSGGSSYIVSSDTDDAFYYIESIIEESMFVLGVSFPDEFEPAITDFELYVDGTQIGERTSIDNQIKHLTLDLQSVTEVKLVFYDGDTFVDACAIDSTLARGEISLVTGIETEEVEEVLATYSLSTNEVTGITQLTLEKSTGQESAYYSVYNESGQLLGGQEYIEITESFTYLNLVKSDFGQLEIYFYDADQELLNKGTFKETMMQIIKSE